MAWQAQKKDSTLTQLNQYELLTGSVRNGCTLNCHTDEVSFLLTVRPSVGAENLVEPHGWFAIHVGVLPGVPRQIGLRFAGDESPIDGGHVIFLCDGQCA